MLSSCSVLNTSVTLFVLYSFVQALRELLSVLLSIFDQVFAVPATNTTVA